MRRVKRAAVGIRSKQPYIDCANGLEEGGVKIGAEFMPEESVYLIDDLAEGSIDLETLLEPYYAVIFEEELGGWHRCREQETSAPDRRLSPRAAAGSPRLVLDGM
jgi:hypothetical protein